MYKPCNYLKKYLKKNQKCSKVLDRASKVTFNSTYKKLTSSEKHYIEQGVVRIFEGSDVGGYGGKYKRYILDGGRKPKPIK